MTDEPQFPSPRRRTKPPARPPGLVNLSKRQESKAKTAEALYSQARREGWTRGRFYKELTDRPSYKDLSQKFKDYLIDAYTAPKKVAKEHKVIPDGYTPRTIQESAIELVNYVQDLEEDGANYVVIRERYGYRVYVQPKSP